MRRWVVPLLLVSLASFFVLGIVSIAISGAHADAQAAKARVAACSKVTPAAARGACVDGKPATVTVIKVVTKYRSPPTYSIDGLIERCINTSKQDQKDLEQVIDNDGGIPAGAWGGSVASGLGACLQGVGTMTNIPLPQQ